MKTLVWVSSRGLNIHLNTSNAQVSLAFANYWRELCNRLSGMQEQKAPPLPRPAEAPSGPKEQASQILGISDGASEAEISAAYRRLAQMYHPDKVAGLAPEFQALLLHARQNSFKRPQFLVVFDLNVLQCSLRGRSDAPNCDYETKRLLMRADLPSSDREHAARSLPPLPVRHFFDPYELIAC
jgi:DnaJ domain